MLQQAGIAVIVFRRNDNQAVSTLHRLGKVWILDCFAGIIDRKWQITNINKYSFYAFAPLDLAKNEPGHVLAGPPFTYGAENHRNEEWSSVRVVHLIAFTPSI